MLLRSLAARTLLITLMMSWVPFAPAQAWTRMDYSAQLIVVHAPSLLQPGKQATVEMVIKNTGKAPWLQKDKNEVSMYHYDSKKKLEVASVFKDSSWLGADRVGRLPVERVLPGDTVTWKFLITAPQKLGTYSLEFIPVAEDLARIGGGKAVFSIQVTGTPVASNPASSVSKPVIAPIAVPTETSANAYAGYLMLRSEAAMKVLGNGRQQFTFGFKNNGTQTWSSRSVKAAGIEPALGSKLGSVRDESWLDASTPISMTGVVKPGELGFVTFTLKGPAKAGSYRAAFQLYADNQKVEGALVEIPITVTADGYIEPEPKPVTPTPTNTPTTQVTSPAGTFVLNPQPLNGDVTALPDQPMIRVGLLNPADYQMEVKASHVELEVYNNGAKICTVPLNDEIEVTYDVATNLYALSGSVCPTQNSSFWYVVKAKDGISPMTLSDYVRPVSWLPGANDNTFRAQLELRYAVKPKEIWVINELPIESYLKGIAETSNVSPAQYQRALLTAARTYAMYHVNRGTKHASQNFTVDATYDQVYRGYGQEARSPTITEAVDATRGQIVTYNGKLAITPYFSRSDGKTRNYEDVWGGQPIDWLKAVNAPGDEGKTLWGHGVGLSASSALYMDAKLGKNYDEILKQFYTGIELRKAYK